MGAAFVGWWLEIAYRRNARAASAGRGDGTPARGRYGAPHSVANRRIKGRGLLLPTVFGEADD